MGLRPAEAAGQGAGSDDVRLPADGRTPGRDQHGPAAMFMYDDDHGSRIVVLTRPMSRARIRYANDASSERRYQRHRLGGRRHWL